MYILSNILAFIYQAISIYAYMAFYNTKITKKQYAMMCLIANPFCILSSICSLSWGNLWGQVLWLLIHIDIVFYNHRTCQKIFKYITKYL